MRYFGPKVLVYLNRRIVAETGGHAGVRDMGLLESAVYRPRATFGGQDLYPDLFSKVAALGHSLIKNHAFLDGNKRTGYEGMRLLLRLNGYGMTAGVDKAFQFVQDIANDRIREDGIAAWLKSHSSKT